MVAFLADDRLKRDDHAPLIFAHNLLASSNEFPASYGVYFAQSFSALFHGTLSPTEVFEKSAHAHLACGPAIKINSQINELMDHNYLVNKVSALYKAWRIIEEKKIVPPGLVRYPTISLRYLIDLTALEVAVIKSLSRLGLYFDICFPLDFAKRSLNVAVDFAARQFENSAELENIDLSFDKLSNSGPLAPLIDALFIDTSDKVVINQSHCQLLEAESLHEEAHQVASRIAQQKAQTSGSIALVMRTYDQRAELFKRALVAHNLSVKDRKGQPLLESPSGILLQTILSARLHVLPKSDFLSLINHPLFFKHLSDDAERSALIELLGRLGIDDSFLALSLPFSRYESTLNRFEKSENIDDRSLLSAQSLRNLVSDLHNMLALLAARDSFAGFLESLRQIIALAFRLEHSSVQALIDIIAALGNSPAHTSSTEHMELGDFITILKGPLSSITVARPDHSDLDAVEFLLLPELVGRHFDHVFIADISFGHMPKNPQVDPIFSDEQRLILNKTLGCHALRVFLDDPFEPLPVPPRQALEPFWFATAIASAQESVHFSYARHNQNGVEQAPSEFFTWLKDHVVGEHQESKQQIYISPEYARFKAGQQEALYSKSSQALALKQRKMAFKNQDANTFAFGFNESQMLERFGGRLGPKPFRALTPTMVEAFARCRFYGFLTRIIGLETHDTHADDLDARVLGHIAHQTLELYFARDTKPLELKNLLKRVALDYEHKNYLLSPEIFWCYIEWLYEALAKLIDQLERYAMHAPLAQEQSFGLKSDDLEAIVIKAQDQSYLIGGVIDRVDRIDKHIALIDYKLSSSNTLRATGSSSALCRANFQVPIYLRLAAHAWAQNDPALVSFAFASIRDGQVLAPLTKAKYPDVFERIFDDNHPEGLASALHHIFSPLSKGEAVAIKGEHCSTCQFSAVCRVAEGTA